MQNTGILLNDEQSTISISIVHSQSRQVALQHLSRNIPALCKGHPYVCVRPIVCESAILFSQGQYLSHGLFFSVAFLSPLEISPTIGYRWTRYKKPLITPNEMNLRTSMPPSTVLFSSIHCRSFLPCRREQYNSNRVAKTGRFAHPARC